MVSASALGHDESPINCEELLVRCMGNSALMQRVLTKFMEQVGTDIDALVAAISQHHASESVHLAHKVRGTCLSVSAIDLAKIAESIEQLAATADEVHLSALSTTLTQERIRIFTFIDAGSLASHKCVKIL